MARGTLLIPVDSSHSVPCEDWLVIAKKVMPVERLQMIDTALRALPTEPTTEAVFFRKKLLRLQDSSRLEAGMVTPAQLQLENSAFNRVDFRKAFIDFRARRRHPGTGKG